MLSKIGAEKKQQQNWEKNDKKLNKKKINVKSV
jgi:hypothetical protein